MTGDASEDVKVAGNVETWTSFSVVVRTRCGSDWEHCVNTVGANEPGSK